MYNYPELLSADIIYIPVVVLEELDRHSHSNIGDKAYFARAALRFIHNNSSKIKYIIKNNTNIVKDCLGWSNDNDILDVSIEIETKDENSTLVTCDRNMSEKANAFNIKCTFVSIKDPVIYKGYEEISLDECGMANLYSTHNNNYGLVNGEYAIFKDGNDTIVDVMCCKDNQLIPISSKQLKSRQLGIIKPLDIQQQMVIDSFNRNDITVIHGRAGSGKTLLSLGYIFSGLETQKIRKCYIIYHYETLKNAKTLGFEKGSHLEKVMTTGSIGNILTSKLGDSQTVENLILTNQLEIIPTANIRGVEFGSNDIVFVTEAQNIDAYTVKTIVQRCAKGCKIIFEGDIIEQQDINRENGISKMINTFKGQPWFGCVKLKQDWRSDICALADKIV